MDLIKARGLLQHDRRSPLAADGGAPGRDERQTWRIRARRVRVCTHVTNAQAPLPYEAAPVKACSGQPAGDALHAR